MGRQAIGFLLKSISIRQSLGADSLSLRAPITNLASGYISIEEYDSAEFYADLAIRLNSNAVDTYGLANSLYIKGLVYKNNTETAKKYFRKGLQKGQLVGAPVSIVQNTVQLARMLFYQDSLSSALLELHKIDTLVKKCGLKHQKNYYGINSILHHKMKDFQRSSDLFFNFTKVNDSLNLVSKKKRLAEMSANILLRDQERKFIELKNQEQLSLLKQVEAEKRSKLILLAVIILILTGLIIGWLNYQLLKKKNGQLKQHRFEIQRLIETQREIIQTKSEELIVSENMIERYAFRNSHELRAPLARILGLVDVLRYENLPENEFLNLIHESSQELDEVVSKISHELRDRTA